jgi:outer membrane protein OmpA-like peptidoglycan-associated protein
LNKYDDTEVKVLGHTDNTGTDKYNLSLSKKRATAVKDYLVTQAVAGSRLSTQGYGEADPIATMKPMKDANLTAGGGNSHCSQ